MVHFEPATPFYSEPNMETKTEPFRTLVLDGKYKGIWKDYTLTIFRPNDGDDVSTTTVTKAMSDLNVLVEVHSGRVWKVWVV